MKTFPIRLVAPADAAAWYPPGGEGTLSVDSESVRFSGLLDSSLGPQFELANVGVERAGKRLSIEVRGGNSPSFMAFEAVDEWEAETIELLLAGKMEALPELSLRFVGKTPEYFRIWIVNVCLTLLTLGIFSAWAKVRSKRYLYSHTLLDGTPFQYLGQPLPILRGRLIAVALFLIYFISDSLFTSILPLVLLAGLALAPWVVARSAAFNARYSAYRNMTFAFDGDYRAALVTLYWLGLIPMLVIIWSALAWVGGPASAGAAFAVFGIALAVLFAVFAFCLPWWLARLKRFLVGNTRFGGISGRLTIRGGQLWRIYFLGGLVAGLAGGVGNALASVLTAVVGAIFVIGSEKLDLLAQALPFLLGYAFGTGYIQARSGNLVWNGTRLGPLRFQGALRAFEMGWLYVGNTLAIVGTAALMTPWAVVRTAKYRASHMRVLLDGDLAEFEGSETGSVRAVGAEIAQVFDLDLSL
jgi:uncharacterized membrane protein YjgN (DUF898 family)